MSRVTTTMWCSWPVIQQCHPEIMWMVVNFSSSQTHLKFKLQKQNHYVPTCFKIGIGVEANLFKNEAEMCMCGNCLNCLW